MKEVSGPPLASRMPNSKRGLDVPISAYIDDVARSVAFLSRLPVPSRHFENYDGSLARAARAFPLAGILIALPAAALAAVLVALRVDPLFAALAVLAVETLATGALHEDGLSDAADGIGGGRDRDHALAIMKDSRAGSYGVVALILAFGLRATALAAILSLVTPTGGAMVVLAVAAASRTAMVWHWFRLPPARSNGVAAAAGIPEDAATRIALITGAVVTAALLLPHLSLSTLVLFFVAVAGAVLAANRVASGKIGGHTGDTIGATQQLAAVAALAALAIGG